MTSVIRPIFLVIKSEDKPHSKHTPSLKEIMGFDPLRQTDQNFQRDLSKTKFSQIWTDLRNWCKGGSRNSRVVLISHQEINRYKAFLEAETANLKDKLPRTWQVFDTAELAKESLVELKQRYNISLENDAQVIHQIFTQVTKGLDSSKVYECMFKPNPAKLILEMSKTTTVAAPELIPLPSKIFQPITILECYYHLETVNVFDKNFVDRIVGISAYIPSKFGEDRFFNRLINPEAVIHGDYQNKPKLKSVLAQFKAWVGTEEENFGHVLFVSYDSRNVLENILRNESARVKEALPTKWRFADLFLILKAQYPNESESTLELSRLARRFKTENEGSSLMTLAKITQVLSESHLLQALVCGKSAAGCLPAQLPEDIQEMVEENSIFYFKDQEKSRTEEWVIEDMLDL